VSTIHKDLDLPAAGGLAFWFLLDSLEFRRALGRRREKAAVSRMARMNSGRGDGPAKRPPSAVDRSLSTNTPHSRTERAARNRSRASSNVES